MTTNEMTKAQQDVANKIKASVRSYRGCNTHKVWIDEAGEVHNERGRGTVPSDYCDACHALTDLLGTEITY